MAAPVRRDSDQFNLRLPDGMRERIAEAAKAANRSMNAEIVARLELSFQHEADYRLEALTMKEFEDAERRRLERLRSEFDETRSYLAALERRMAGIENYVKIYGDRRETYQKKLGEPDDA